MKLTDVVALWDLLPLYADEADCSEHDLEHSFNFEDFVNIVHKVVGVEVDIEVLREV